MGSVKSGYSISPVSRDQNLLKVMPGFHSTLSPSTQKPCSIVGTKIPSPRVHHFATPTPPALAITSPGSTSATFLRFSMTKYLHAASKDRKQGTSILDLSTLGKSQSYVTGSPVFEPLNSNKGGEIGITPRRNTLDPSQLLGKVVRRNSYSPAFAELKNIRRNSLRNSFVDEKLSVSSKILGSGGFGAVYLGVLNRNKVAVKKFHTQKKNLKAKAESFRSELTAKRLVHPNVVRILATSDVEDFSKGVIVMEYVGDRNLHQELLQSKRPLSRRTMLSYALDLARALDFIHCNSVVHLDVKPANVLITTEGSCKLGDFGCCQVLQNGAGQVSPTQRSYLTGTYAYRAPELLKGVAPCTKADIYSMGITMWQIYSRQLPYLGQNQHVVIFGVVAHNLRPDNQLSTDNTDGDQKEKACGETNGKIIDEAYRAAYVKSWDTDPKNRPCAKELTMMLEPFVSRCE